MVFLKDTINLNFKKKFKENCSKTSNSNKVKFSYYFKLLFGDFLMKKLLILTLIIFLVFLFGCSDKLDYVGDLNDGKPHGKGTLIYDDESKYEGQWKDGMIPHILFHEKDESYFPNNKTVVLTVKSKNKQLEFSQEIKKQKKTAKRKKSSKASEPAEN